MGLWVANDVEVYNGATSGFTRNLDLSAHVGANVAYVLLGVLLDTAHRITFIPDGSFSALQTDSAHHGTYYVHVTDTTKWALVAIPTGTNGVVRHRCTSGATIINLTVRLLGHCVLSAPGPWFLPGYMGAPATEPVGLAWGPYDLSALQGAAVGFACMEYRGGVGSIIGLRTPGDIRDTEYISDAVQGGANRGLNLDPVASNGGMFANAQTDSTGRYEHVSSTGANSYITWWGSEVDNYVPVNTVIQDSILTQDDWNDINLSAHVPNRALCILKVENGASGSQAISLYPRRKDEVRDFALGNSYGMCHTTDNATGRATDILIECNDSGITELYSYYGAVPTTSVRITLVGYIPSTASISIDSVIPGYLSLRVIFSDPMLADAELLNPDNYTIDVTNPSDDIDFECLSVQAEDTTYPSYVDLVMTDCKHGGNYEVVVPPDTMQTQTGGFITAGNNTKTFVGVSELPNVLSCYSVSSTSMRVVFSKTMSVNDDLDNPTRYTFTNNLRVLSVQVETPSSVLLTTSEQVQSYMYDLTVG